MIHVTPPQSAPDFIKKSPLRLGKFISKLEFWKMSPNPGSIADLPDEMAANVLSNKEYTYAIQLLDSKQNNQIELIFHGIANLAEGSL